MSFSAKKLKSLNYTGIFFSLLCLVHCLLLPVILSIAPTITSRLEGEWVHLTLLVILIPVALFSLLGGRRYHKKLSPLLIGCLGVTCLLSAVAFEYFGVDGLEEKLTISGSIILIAAHALNLKYEMSVKL